MYKELLGSELLGVPILKGDRAQKWPGLQMAKSFKLFGKCVQESSYDVVLSSAGIFLQCQLDFFVPIPIFVHRLDCRKLWPK